MPVSAAAVIHDGLHGSGAEQRSPRDVNGQQRPNKLKASRVFVC